MKDRVQFKEYLYDEFEFYYPTLPEDEIDFLVETEMENLSGQLFVHPDNIKEYAVNLAQEIASMDCDVNGNLRAYIDFDSWANDLIDDWSIYRTPFKEEWYVVSE